MEQQRPSLCPGSKKMIRKAVKAKNEAAGKTQEKRRRDEDGENHEKTEERVLKRNITITRKEGKGKKSESVAPAATFSSPLAPSRPSYCVPLKDSPIFVKKGKVAVYTTHYNKPNICK